MEIRYFNKGDLPTLLTDATRELMTKSPHPAALLVFANSPATARAVFNRLQKGDNGQPRSDILLLTGRTREVEAKRIRERVLDDERGMAASRDISSARDRHLVVVATQTLEVGADVDAEYLITEACGVRALTQRLGRLNRLGRHPTRVPCMCICLPRRRSSRIPNGRSMAWSRIPCSKGFRERAAGARPWSK